jgi:hypothetical protein
MMEIEMTYVDPNITDDAVLASYCAELTAWLNARSDNTWLVRPPRSGEFVNEGYNTIDGEPSDEDYRLADRALENCVPDEEGA